MVTARLKRLLDAGPVPSQRAGDDEAGAFREYALALTLRNGRLMTLGIVIGALIAWLLDFVVYASDPATGHVLRDMRIVLAGNAVLCHLALRGRPGAARTLAVAFFMAGSNTLILGHATSLIGDLGTPWFHFTYVCCGALLVPVIPLLTRALLGVTYAAGLLGGMALARPLRPPHPMLVPTMAFVVFTAITGVVLGHILYRMLRDGLANTRARARAARQVEELNRTLEERVRAQTHDLRALAAHIESAREDERTRIARDLHDELGQELAALRYALTFLRQRFDRDPPSVRGNLEELERLLGRAATTTRQILSDLRPRILDDLGLDAAVDWLLQRTEQRAGLRCRRTPSARKLDLDPDLSIATFRILQEALTNIVRHAQATQVDVDLTVADASLRLSVRDDGIGMPESPPPRQPGKGGMGLLGMRERAAALGGLLEIASHPGAGTTILVRLPLADRHPPEELPA